MTLRSDLDLAVRFLLDHAQGGLITLSAIPPRGGRTITRTFPSDRPEEIRAFLKNYSGTHNLYFSVNPLRAVVRKKAKKEDVACLAFYHVDCDPRKGFDREEERLRILEQFESFTPTPVDIGASQLAVEPLGVLVALKIRRDLGFRLFCVGE